MPFPFWEGLKTRKLETISFPRTNRQPLPTTPDHLLAIAGMFFFNPKLHVTAVIGKEVYEKCFSGNKEKGKLSQYWTKCRKHSLSLTRTE